MPIDTSNPFGSGMEDIQFLYAKMENDVRRKRAIDGTINKLKKGQWYGVAPTCYKWDIGNFLPDPNTAPLIRKAFEWKLNNPTLLSEEIRRRFARKGLRITKNTMSRIFRNRIYCGLIAHSLLGGEVIQGKHKALVIRRICLAVNEILEEKNTHGWQVNLEEDHLPLKVFMRCDCCGTPMTGYIFKKQSGKTRKTTIPYYKCRKDGCKNNINANKL